MLLERWRMAVGELFVSVTTWEEVQQRGEEVPLRGGG